MEFFKVLGEVLQESFIDTLKALPLLFCVYILVSYCEHNTHKYVNFFKKAKKFGPVVGGTLGTIPQCGFSVAMADLYNKKNISLGTLIAVFIATSDEAIPILFSNYNFIVPMIILIFIKFAYAVACGFIIDLIMQMFRKKRENNIVLNSSLSHELCECGHTGHTHNECEDNNHHNHNSKSENGEHNHTHCCADNIFVDAIIHTLKIAGFILIVNVTLGLILELSHINLTLLLNINKFLQPFVTSLIGLIPNCFASVLLVEVYMAGGITFGALLAGLSTSAGLGLLILFKSGKKNWKQSLLITLLVYGLGVILGLFTTTLSTII